MEYGVIEAATVEELVAIANALADGWELGLDAGQR